MKFTKKHLTAIASLMLCTSVLFCGCAKKDDVVIKVNDQEITRGQYFDDFNKLKNAQFKNAPKEVRKDSSYAVLSFKEKYSNDVVMRAILNQELDKRNIQATDEEIAAKQKKIVEQIGSEEQFKKILKENDISEEKLREDLIQEVRIDKLVDALGVKDATVAEAQEFYNKNKAQFTMPESAHVSHILIETSPEAIKRNIADADKEAKLSSADIDAKVKEEVARKEALAKEVLAKVKANPKDFAKIAKEFSDDKGSAENGGDLGYITRESVVKEFGDVVFTQKIGEVSPLVKSQFGQHIIIVYDRAKAGAQPFDKVKNDLIEFLTQKKKVDAVQELMTGLKNSAKIEFLDESLNPANIEKQLDEALQKQLKERQKTNPDKSLQHPLEKTQEDKK